MLPKRRGLAVALTLTVGLSVLAACTGDDAADGDPSCDVDGSTDRQEASSDDPGEFTMVSVRHEVVAPQCERLVFELESSEDDGAELAYSVAYREGPLQGPSGPIEMDGDALIEIVIQGTSAQQGLEAPLPAEDSSMVVDVVRLPEVPGGSLWAIGAKRRHPFTASVVQDSSTQLIVTLTGPTGG